MTSCNVTDEDDDDDDDDHVTADEAVLSRHRKTTQGEVAGTLGRLLGRRVGASLSRVLRCFSVSLFHPPLLLCSMLVAVVDVIVP